MLERERLELLLSKRMDVAMSQGLSLLVASFIGALESLVASRTAGNLGNVYEQARV